MDYETLKTDFIKLTVGEIKVIRKVTLDDFVIEIMPDLKQNIQDFLMTKYNMSAESADEIILYLASISIPLEYL